MQFPLSPNPVSLAADLTSYQTSKTSNKGGKDGGESRGNLMSVPNGDATEPKGKKKNEENKGRADIIRLSGMELFPVNFTVEIKSEEKDITVTVFSR